jgi:hypothetical protein
VVVAVVVAETTVAGPVPHAAAAGGTTAAAHGTTPPADGTAPQTGGTTPVAERGNDGGAVALWVAGEVILLVAGAVALRLWTGRRSRRARDRAGGRLRPVPPVDACDACTGGWPCAGGSAAGERCDRPPVRIRL